MFARSNWLGRRSKLMIQITQIRYNYYASPGSKWRVNTCFWFWMSTSLSFMGWKMGRRCCIQPSDLVGAHTRIQFSSMSPTLRTLKSRVTRTSCVFLLWKILTFTEQKTILAYATPNRGSFQQAEELIMFVYVEIKCFNTRAPILICAFN